MGDVGASTSQFDAFCSLVQAGIPVEVTLARIGVPPYVQAFVAHTMALANLGTTEEILAAFFYGREDITPEMFSRLLRMETVMAPRGGNCWKASSRTLQILPGRMTTRVAELAVRLGGSCGKLDALLRHKPE
jgi:hypothetical protein